MTCETRRLAAFCVQEGPVRPGRDARRPDGLFESLPEAPESNKKRRGFAFPQNLFFGALEGTRTPGLLIRSLEKLFSVCAKAR